MGAQTAREAARDGQTLLGRRRRAPPFALSRALCDAGAVAAFAGLRRFHGDSDVCVGRRQEFLRGARRRHISSRHSASCRTARAGGRHAGTARRGASAASFAVIF